MKNKLIICGAIASLSGCAAMKGPPGPKLYDNVTIAVTSENALVVPSTVDKDFMRILTARMTQFTEQEISSQGDLQIAQACGPRTLKLSQDIASVTLSGQAYTSGSMNPFRASVTTTKGDDVRIMIDMVVQDCETGKKLYTYSYSHNGLDAAQVLKDHASWNVSYMYSLQHGPRSAK